MKRAGRLMGRVLERENLREAYLRAARGKRSKPDAMAFGARLDEELARLVRDVEDGTYRVGAYRKFTIFDPKERTITAPCFRDRVLHHALMLVCEPVFERTLIDDTYACRCGKGRIAALERAFAFARSYPWYLKMDVRKYFDSIDHEVLMAKLARRFKDPRVLDLFGKIIESHQAGPGRGLPIGSLTSQHFANFYLSGLDRSIKEDLKVGGYVRYMDDLVAWGDDRAGLLVVRDHVGSFLQVELRLELKTDTPLNRVHMGMGFLGCRVYSSHVTLNRRSRRRFRRKLRWLEREHRAGRLGEAELQRRGTALVAFTQAGPTASWRLRDRVIGSSLVDDQGLEPRESRG